MTFELNSFVMRVGNLANVSAFYQDVLFARVESMEIGFLMYIGSFKIYVSERKYTPTILAGRKNLEDLHALDFEWTGSPHAFLRHIQKLDHSIDATLDGQDANAVVKRFVFRYPEGLLISVTCRETKPDKHNQRVDRGNL